MRCEDSLGEGGLPDLTRAKEDEGLVFEQSRFDLRLDLTFDQHSSARSPAEFIEKLLVNQQFFDNRRKTLTW
jgi:hypothetical protein